MQCSAVQYLFMRFFIDIDVNQSAKYDNRPVSGPWSLLYTEYDSQAMIMIMFDVPLYSTVLGPAQ